MLFSKMPTSVAYFIYMFCKHTISVKHFNMKVFFSILYLTYYSCNLSFLIYGFSIFFFYVLLNLYIYIYIHTYLWLLFLCKYVTSSILSIYYSVLASPYGRTKRIRWSQKKKETAFQAFSQHMKELRLPSLKEIQNVKKRYIALAERTSPQIKTWLNNQQKALRKCKYLLLC